MLPPSSRNTSLTARVVASLLRSTRSDSESDMVVVRVPSISDEQNTCGIRKFTQTVRVLEVFYGVVSRIFQKHGGLWGYQVFLSIYTCIFVVC